MAKRTRKKEGGNHGDGNEAENTTTQQEGGGTVQLPAPVQSSAPVAGIVGVEIRAVHGQLPQRIERHMSPVVVNLEGVKTSLEVIPDGKYPAKFSKFTFAMSKAQQPKVTLEFIFDNDGDDNNPAGGRKAFVECSLQPQALFKIKKALIDMGTDPEVLEGQVNLEEALAACIGADTTINVKHHEWEGSTRNDFYVVSPDSWTSN